MTRDFKIHSICVVKNEADIIKWCLEAALQWSDRIIVYDGKSEDNTWEIVGSMASDKIVPWKQDGKTFQESLRAEVFNAFRENAQPGDWWCHLDADEFYFENPRPFLTRVPWPYHVVWGIAVEFYFTDEDLLQGLGEPAGDIKQHIERLRYYDVTNSEPRFFRHRSRLEWPVNVGWPLHMGPAYPERLLYKHYKYRSPGQIQQRLDTRRRSIEHGFSGWQHAQAETWREKIPAAAGLKKLGEHGVEYDERNLPSHLEQPLKRYLKLALHGAGVFP